MVSDALYLALANALGQPSRAYRAASTGLEGVGKGIEGFLTGEKIRENRNERKYKEQPISDYFGNRPVFGLSPQTSTMAFEKLAPLAKDVFDPLAYNLGYNNNANTYGIPTKNLPQTSETPGELPNLGSNKDFLAGQKTAQTLGIQHNIDERQKRSQDAANARQAKMIEAMMRKSGASAVAKASAASSELNTGLKTLDSLAEEKKKLTKQGYAGSPLASLTGTVASGLTGGKKAGGAKSFDDVSRGTITVLKKLVGQSGVLSDFDTANLARLQTNRGEADSVTDQKLKQLHKIAGFMNSGNYAALDAYLQFLGIKTQESPFDKGLRPQETEEAAPSDDELLQAAGVNLSE